MKPGGTLRSPGGVLFVDAVEAIEEADITDEDARAAGHVDRADVLSILRPDGTLYRFRFHRIGDDPRRALREDVDVAAIEAKLARLAWALPVLRLIRDNEGVVSTELAPHVGMERLPFKQKVRRLKELGLTESLETGYRLSPRGAAYLDSVVVDD